MKRQNIVGGLLVFVVVGLLGCSATEQAADMTESVSQAGETELEEMSTVETMEPDVAQSFTGVWLLEKNRSTAIDPWRNLSLEVAVDGGDLEIKRKWRGSREGGAFTDSSRMMVGGSATKTRLLQWPDNRHLGAYIAGDGTKTISARSEDEGTTLITESTLLVSVQQGHSSIRIYSEYRISPDGDRLDLIELRSTRPTPVHYVFRREAQ